VIEAADDKELKTDEKKKERLSLDGDNLKSDSSSEQLNRSGLRAPLIDLQTEIAKVSSAVQNLILAAEGEKSEELAEKARNLAFLLLKLVEMNEPILKDNIMKPLKNANSKYETLFKSLQNAHDSQLGYLQLVIKPEKLFQAKGLMVFQMEGVLADLDIVFNKLVKGRQISFVSFYKPKLSSILSLSQ